jgi:hypothetical protein
VGSPQLRSSGGGSSHVLDTVIASFEAEAEPLKARVELVKAEAVLAGTEALNAETEALNAKTEASKARTEAIEATNAASDAMLEAIEAETEANKVTKEASHAMIEALKAGTEVIKVTNEASDAMTEVKARLEALNAELKSHTRGDLRSFMRDVLVPVMLAVLAKCACKSLQEPYFFLELNVGSRSVNNWEAIDTLRPHLDSDVVKRLEDEVCI